MAQITNINELYIDGNLKTNIELLKKIIRKDWDMVSVIDGKEGAGKSVFAHQLARLVDDNFNIDRICFTPEEFEKAIKTANKYEAVVYDEGYTGLSSRGTMTEINKILVEMLAEIRQRNLFIFIVVPSFFDLDRYVALHRSRFLFHIYTGENWSRGFFAVYDENDKKTLYLLGKKLYTYSQPKIPSTKRGRFLNTYVVDEEAYRLKKLKSLQHKNVKKQKDDLRFPIALKALCNHVSSRKAEQELKALGLELSYRRISQLIENHEENVLEK